MSSVRQGMMHIKFYGGTLPLCVTVTARMVRLYHHLILQLSFSKCRRIRLGGLGSGNHLYES